MIHFDGRVYFRWAPGVAVALALICALVPIDAMTVEMWFSSGIYPRVQARVTGASNLVPFAVLDVLLIVVAGATSLAVCRAVMRARRERRWLLALPSLWNLCGVAAVCYLLFLGLWGLNYRRIPMSARLAMRAGAVRQDEVLALGREAAARLNALHAAAHAEGWPGEEWHDPHMLRGFDAVQQLLNDAPRATPGRLKHTMLAPYFRWTSVDGMVNPFALEVLANSDLLPFERPFVAAHEWAHLAGYADESEANFVGWLTCLRAGPAGQYSAWLFLYWQVYGEIIASERTALTDALAAGPRADLAAMIARLQRGQLPLLRRMTWRVYDQYLRANRVEEGIRSYGEVVNLILRARFDAGWTPVRRGSVAGP